MAWASPDKKFTIWDLVTKDGQMRQTFSEKIAHSIGRPVEVESWEKNGKTYWRLPKSAGYGGNGKPPGRAGDSVGMAWGNALTNAVSTVIPQYQLMENYDSLVVADKVIEVAKKYFTNRPDG